MPDFTGLYYFGALLLGMVLGTFVSGIATIFIDYGWWFWVPVFVGGIATLAWAFIAEKG